MSAHSIYETAPLGALIRYSDGTPRPPERFRKKLAAWKGNNGTGRLIAKKPPIGSATYTSAACFKLHEGDFGSGGAIFVAVLRFHTIDSPLNFDVVEVPPVGTVRILRQVGDRQVLLQLASDTSSAEAWIAEHRHSQTVIEEVAADPLNPEVFGKGPSR